jgi:4-hydroxy-tetrahydrodipicolinate reductase
MTQKNVKISVAGSGGRMGKMLVNVIDSFEGCSLVAATCHPNETDIIGKDAGIVSGINKLNIPISLDPKELLKGEVIIDFTSPESTIANSFLAAEKNIGHVIGTTGLSKDQEKVIEDNSQKNTYHLFC